MSAFEDRLLALAGMAQALAQVRRLADTGQADGAHLQPLIESVFRIDAETPAAVYGGVASVAPGLRILRAHFGNQARDPVLKLLAVVVCLCVIELSPHLAHAAFHPGLCRIAGDECGRILGGFRSVYAAELVKRRVLERNAGLR